VNVGKVTVEGVLIEADVPTMRANPHTERYDEVA
jgi:hypothetical protein